MVDLEELLSAQLSNFLCQSWLLLLHFDNFVLDSQKPWRIENIYRDQFFQVLIYQESKIEGMKPRDRFYQFREAICLDICPVVF